MLYPRKSKHKYCSIIDSYKLDKTNKKIHEPIWNKLSSLYILKQDCTGFENANICLPSLNPSKKRLIRMFIAQSGNRRSVSCGKLHQKINEKPLKKETKIIKP